MKRLIALSFILSLVAGCGSELQSLKNCEVVSCEGLGNGDLGNSNPNGPPLTWADIKLNAEVSGGVHDHQQSIFFNSDTKMIKFRIPISGGAFLGPASAPSVLPEIDNATLHIEVDSNGLTSVIVEMQLDTLLKGFNGTNQSDSLPNGLAIPNFPSGTYSYIDFDMGENNATSARVYMGKGVFGMFIETPFNPFIQIAFPSKNDNGEVLGYLTQVAAQGSFAGGYFKSIVIPDNIKFSIQNLP